MTIRRRTLILITTAMLSASIVSILWLAWQVARAVWG